MTVSVGVGLVGVVLVGVPIVAVGDGFELLGSPLDVAVPLAGGSEVLLDAVLAASIGELATGRGESVAATIGDAPGVAGSADAGPHSRIPTTTKPRAMRTATCRRRRRVRSRVGDIRTSSRWSGR
jgi:hypothetical protein